MTLSYAQYRELKGICDTCGAAMKTHPICQACGALGHLFTLATYRERELCLGCIRSWQILEKETGKLLTWEQVKKKWYLHDYPAKRKAKAAIDS